MVLDRVLPDTAELGDNGHLVLGGCDTTQLAKQFGTPLYIFDEETIRNRCRQYIGEFQKRYSQTKVAYASKAFINPALARLFMEEGMGLDIVSSGELAVARAVDFPVGDVYFHGNNKGPDELEEAINCGIGRIVVDNFHEMTLLDDIATRIGKTQDVLLRISPGVDPHTHSHTTTGILDSKFGFPLETGQAKEAVIRAVRSRSLNLKGLHFHLGSPIFELDPYRAAMDIVLNFASTLREDGLNLKEISPGGGFAIAYTRDQNPPSVSDYAETIVSSMIDGCSRLNMELPTLIIEPGRAITGPSGVAIYKVGSTKNIEGVRKYVSVDGGMGDNIRPVLYDSNYEALVANNMNGESKEKVTIVGKYCESGDVLVKDVILPILSPDDIIAIPASGAYCLPMSSNYNLNPKPPVIMVKDGDARIIRRRETFSDQMSLDVE